MFFYIDESGNTGKNLFDPDQPVLYYGVLSSSINLDILAKKDVCNLRKKLGVVRLHAADLSMNKLVEIANNLYLFKKKYSIRFDIFRLFKADYALISFFDQVFDSGMNPAVSWLSYFTPVRYVLLLKVASLFDEATMKKAWAARIETNDKNAHALLAEVCSIILDRVCSLPDQRSQQLIGDALRWTILHPDKIDYNVDNKYDILFISPNSICFQFVMQNIAYRIRKKNTKASKITIDIQFEFNKSQQKISRLYSSSPVKTIQLGIGLPEVNLKDMPNIPLTFVSSDDSVGLELVDIYLWIFSRFLENKYLPDELLPIIRKFMHCGYTNEISLNALASKWESIFDDMQEPRPDQIKKAEEIVEREEKKRLEAIRNSLK